MVLLLIWLIVAAGVVGGILASIAGFASGWVGVVGCVIVVPLLATQIARLRGRERVVVVVAGAALGLGLAMIMASAYST